MAEPVASHLVLNVGADEAGSRAKADTLRSAGLNIVDTRTGRSAMALAARHHPAVVLVNANPPDVASADLCRRIHRRWPEILVIHVAATPPVETGAYPDSAPDCTLLEPLAAAELVAVTRAMLRLRRAEESERHHRTHYRTIMDGAEDCAIFTCDLTGCITNWNAGARAILGYAPEEIVGQPHTRLFTETDIAAAVPALMLAEVQGGKALRAERWHRRRDGTPVWGSCRSTPLRNSASEVVGCMNIFHDHSSERQARDMLLGLNRQLASRIAMRIAALEQADHRQEADPRPHSDTADADDGAASPTPSGEKILGQLTGGIAHDFNNLLTAIIGGLELTRRQVNDARSQRLIDGALAAAHRGAHLVSQLLAFSRQQMLHQEPVSLASLVTEACPLLERTAGSAITLRTALKRDVWPVMIDPHQMRIALVNLVANARDAMPTGGVLRIAVRNLATKAPSGRAGTREASPRGDWVAIEVHDSGAGMTHEVKARVFEPFFTTKPVGAGAGLGLAQVYGFIRQSGGDVRIETRVGHGTRIRLLLPRIASA